MYIAHKYANDKKLESMLIECYIVYGLFLKFARRFLPITEPFKYYTLNELKNIRRSAWTPNVSNKVYYKTVERIIL